MSPPWDRVAAHLGDKTPLQAFLRYLLMDIELRNVMEPQEVETPPEWDLQETAAPPPPTSEQPAPLTALMAIKGEDVDMQALVAIGAEDVEIQALMAIKVEDLTCQHLWLFLAGIEKHGKGKWKTLAREFVKTKSSTQIASHYQKFTIRGEKRQLNLCRRKSIHDITGPPPPCGTSSTLRID
ncbi:hypothetical protein GUJ93_ZPchr0149g29153 [Zizania palustris]|uniref:HTH myb-type domain-containing protein n=1 Tax=Zizania palustris TaxID=103762 RepID=A0A8J5REU9_ZIZPA|nr:hypothetical protein GUJ93_ZPchr0149g29153 [Zizania palustris]